MRSIKNIVWDYVPRNNQFVVQRDVTTIEFDTQTNEPKLEREVLDFNAYLTEFSAAQAAFQSAVQDNAGFVIEWSQLLARWGLTVTEDSTGYNSVEFAHRVKPTEDMLHDLKTTPHLFRACLGARATDFLMKHPETSGVWRPHE